MDKIGVPTKVVRDGTLYWTRDLEDVVWAALGANPIGVWCCVDATYGRGLTAEQRTAIPEVEAFIFRLLNRTATVSGHGLLRSYQSSTDCPGPEILAYLKETGRGNPI